jgi:hypothetical protein
MISPFRAARQERKAFDPRGAAWWSLGFATPAEPRASANGEPPGSPPRLRPAPPGDVVLESAAPLLGASPMGLPYSSYSAIFPIVPTRICSGVWVPATDPRRSGRKSVGLSSPTPSDRTGPCQVGTTEGWPRPAGMAHPTWGAAFRPFDPQRPGNGPDNSRSRPRSGSPAWSGRRRAVATAPAGRCDHSGRPSDRAT